MKIGLVLFGHLRSYRQTHDSFQQLKNSLERLGAVDVFCHTWDIEESVTASWWKEHKAEDPPPPTVDPGEIVSKYGPVQYSIESSRQFDGAGYAVNSSVPIGGILSMLHSQKRAFDILCDHEQQGDFKYDMIVKTRYDLVYEISPSFPDLAAKCIFQNCLFLPSSNPYELIGSRSDVFAIGPRLLMEQYFSFCCRFREATNLYENENYRHFVPELCMTLYLDKNSIAHKELTGLRIHILRSSGEKVQINTERNFSDNNPYCFHLKMIEKNEEILPEGSDISRVNGLGLAKKYTSWLDPDASETILHRYADFYCGQWPGSRYIKRLAKKSKNNRVFTNVVMKDFFERAINVADSGLMKLFFLVTTLSVIEGTGFYFRVWKNRLLKRTINKN